MTTQEVIDNFSFSKEGNYKAAEMAVILNKLSVKVRTLDHGIETSRRGVILNILKKKEGITPSEFMEFMGYSHEDHRWIHSDGMSCGITIINGVLHTVVDYGGFNTKPATYRVKSISKDSNDIIFMPANPNGYSIHAVEVQTITQLQSMGVL